MQQTLRGSARRVPAPVAYRSVGALAVAEEARFVLVDVTVARAHGDGMAVCAWV